MSWLRRFSIRARHALFATLSLVFILGVTGFVGTRALQESTDRLLAERLRLAQVAALHIDDHVVMDMLGRLERAAASQGFDLTDADPEPERRALRELYNSGLFTYDVFIADGQGIVLMTEPDQPQLVGADLSLHSHIVAALATGQNQVSILLTATATSQPLVSFVAPVTDRGGAVVGLVGSTADPASPYLADILTSALNPIEAGHVDVVDLEGQVLASTDPNHTLKASHHRQFLLPLLQSRQAAVGTYPVMVTGVEQGRDVVAVAPLSIAPWAVSIEQPEAEALALVYALRQRLLYIGAAILLTGLASTWIATQALVIPVRQLLAAARRVASGDLATPVAIAGRDEIAELGRGFEAMRQKLAAWGEELEAAVQRRTRELSTLYAIDRAAAQSLQLDEILTLSVDKVLEAMEVEAGVILLLEPNGETITPYIHRGVSDEFLASIRHIRVGEGVSGRAVAKGEPVALDMRDYPSERLAPAVIKEGFQSLASTPLVSKGATLGALTLGAQRPRAFLLEEMKLLESIGQQLGGVVEKARLFEAERQRAAELAASEVRYRTLFESAHDGLYVLDMQGRYIDANPAACQLLGYSQEELLAMDVFQIGAAGRGLSPEKRAQLLEELQAIWRKGTTGYEDQLVAKSGALLPVEMSITPLTYHGQEAVLGAVRDITERKRTEATLRALNAAAAALGKAGLTEAEIYQAASQQLVDLGMRGMISMFDEATDSFSFEYFFLPAGLIMVIEQLTGITAAGFRVPRSRLNAYAQVFESGRAIYIADSTAQLVAQFLPESVSRLAARITGMFSPASSILTPLRMKNRMVGLLHAASGWLTEADVPAITAFADQLSAALENARLFEAEAKRARQLALVSEIARQAAATLERERLLREAAGALARTFNYYDVVLASVDADTEEMVLEARAGRLVRQTPETAREPISEPGIIGWVARHGETLLANDVARDPRYRPFLPDTRAELCVPIKDGEQIIGVINVESEQLHAFDAVDVATIEALAAELAVALRNARLYQETQQRLAELSALFEVSGALRGAETLEQMLPVVLKATLEVMYCDGGAIFLGDPHAEELVVRAVEGVYTQAHSPNMRLKTKGNVPGRVLNSREPYVFREVAAEPLMSPEMRRRLQGIETAIVLPLQTGDSAVGVMSIGKATPHTFTESEIRLLTAIADMAASAIRRAGLHEQLEESYLQTVLALAKTMDARDAYTGDHSQRMADWAAATARELGCSKKEIAAIRWAALLHDIGKIAVPDTILRKPGALTEEEWATMKRHPETGAEIVAPVSRLADVAPIIRAHQEKFDGSGYPDGLRGEEIPRGARILAVVDAYSAITDERVYCKASSHTEAVAELQRCAGTHFDPAVVEAFLRSRIGHA